jgi:hypothetical protein
MKLKLSNRRPSIFQENQLKKVAVMLGTNIGGIGRGYLSQPKKVPLWNLQKSQV